jgi:arginine exporter protein ArgO
VHGLHQQRMLFVLQVMSVTMIWLFVLGISAWIIHLIRISRQLHDVPSASIGISIVAIPVYLTGASVLTYVFVGLRRGRRDRGDDERVEEER